MLKLTPDEAALLKAVSADRQNNLPRLLYADFLDDAGRSERAELIRLQCHPPDPHGVALEPRELADGTFRLAAPTTHRVERAAELLAAYAGRWLRELPKWAVGGGRLHFTRGFVESFEFPAGPFLMYGPQLLDRTPVRGLSLLEVRKLAPRLAACGWLREVPYLSFVGGPLGDRGVVDLTRAEWLSHTRNLGLAGNELGDGAATALADCPQVRRLEVLHLNHNRLTPAGVETLLASPYLIGCRLHLEGNPRLDGDIHAVRRLLGPRGSV